MILAIDVGGTKLAAGLVAHDGTVVRARRAATPQGADAETLWKALLALIGPLVTPLTGVGASTGEAPALPGGAHGGPGEAHSGSVRGPGASGSPVGVSVGHARTTAGGAGSFAGSSPGDAGVGVAVGSLPGPEDGAFGPGDGPGGWRIEGVGVGCGGPMRWPAGEVSPLNIPGWRGFPLRARLAEQFPGVPVRLHNDAVCLAVAEHWRGAGQGTSDMLGMVVSTGVGGGLVLGGRLVDGGTGNAGHVGHVVVEPGNGPPCGCGGRGCLEAVARGPALTAWALARGWRPGSASADGLGHPADPLGHGDGGGIAADAVGYAGDVLGRAEDAAGRLGLGAGPLGDAVGRAGYAAGRLGLGAGPLGDAVGRAGYAAGRRGDVAEGEPYREERAVTARLLAADARAGDEVALAALRRAGRALGVAIASATHLCDLELVTIGGGLSQVGEPLFGALEEALREHARMGFARRVRVTPAALGQDAGLVGAAALILAGDRYWTNPQVAASRSATASCRGR
ncbi:MULTISPECIES: ROK family protein [unclassified Nonomuraea]|uniref:ROK family protein n=1 Tax=unclassified Nonomuraea TaxID=2593643 RepID=UPI0033ED1451